MTPDRPHDAPSILSPDDLRRRRSRSVALALALAGLAIMFYLVTIAKLGPQILNRAL